jgi:N-acetylmuramoyl-L-alanine amidase
MKSLYQFVLVSTAILFVASCAKQPYATTNRFYKKQSRELIKQVTLNPALQIVDHLQTTNWVGTTNFDLRKPNFVIIHHTAQNSCDQTLKTFTLERTKVSAHYVICKNGTIHHMLNDYLRAWHGGVAKWGNNTDINSSSIGIEIDNNGFEPFDSLQINSLLQLLGALKQAYKIPVENFIGHGDIAPGRKVDPNITFPWKQLASNGYGRWFEPNASLNLDPAIPSAYALSLIGYDVKDSVNAIAAFKRHFRQDSSKMITNEDRSVMYQLIQNKFSH